MRYVLVTAGTVEQFNVEVEGYLRAGYRLHGSPVISFNERGEGYMYYQAVTFTPAEPSTGAR